jgi:hypothetical protein
MSAAASTLIPGAGMVQNIIEKLSDQIVAMVDEIMTEKADALMYEVIKPQIAEHMKSIFESYSMQTEASKMFNREIFPIYKRTIEDFANFNSLVKDVNKDIDVAIEEYAKEIIANKDDENKKMQAKQKLIEKLKGVSNTKTGDVLSMKGGDLHAFLGNEENIFKPIDEKPAIKYMGEGTKIISDAIKEIVGKMKDDSDDKNETLKQAKEDDSMFTTKRRESMRVPGSNVLKKKTGDLEKKLKMDGGKSKRRKHRKRNKTHKKRR